MTTFTFLKHKTYLFSFIVLMLASILSSLPAYSQVDYYYGLNKKGFRLGIGAGAAMLQSNWSSNPISPIGLLSIDYDLSPYFSIGVQGQFGQLKGVDADNKFYYKQTADVIGAGNFNIKLALGLFSDFKTSTVLGDAIKRIYIGAGVGVVNSNVTLTRHPNGEGLFSDNIPNLAVAAYLSKPKPVNNTTPAQYTESGMVTAVPINFGTNIALRGILGSDKLDLNPNIQYNLVLSPVFDGYQPNSVPSTTNTFVKVNGNQAYFVGSIALRYKF